jgi:hypothetical protein
VLVRSPQASCSLALHHRVPGENEYNDKEQQMKDMMGFLQKKEKCGRRNKTR